MTLSRFITENMEAIVNEWQTFATTMTPAASTMSALALRDHAKPILLAIAKDLEESQSDAAQDEKAKGLAPPLSTRETAAATHGALRHLSGFDLNQLGAEYRALRASVIRLWTRVNPQTDTAVFEDMIRFNEAVDQAVAESTSRYAAELALSRDTFMAILGHDLRSPLSAITMLSFLMERSATSDTVRKQATQIHRSAKEMATMIHELLDYTRTQLGKGMPVRPKACSMLVIGRDSVDEMRSAHPERQFTLEVPDDLVAMVDNARVRQSLSNLLNNAVQHGDPATAISLVIEADHSNVVMRVTNLGEPIPAESLQVIFDPLVQLASRYAAAQDAPSTNLGLGLFIAREVAIGHGGTLDVVSDAQKGTVFTMRLPIGDVG